MWLVSDFFNYFVPHCKRNYDGCQLKHKQNDKEKKIKTQPELWIKYRTIDFLAPQIIKTSKNSKKPNPMKKISIIVKVYNYLQSQMPNPIRAIAQAPKTMFRNLRKVKSVGLPYFKNLSPICINYYQWEILGNF